MKKYIFKTHLIIPLILVFILQFSQGCKKKENNKLIGSWMKVTMSAREQMENDTTIWTFYDGNMMIRYQAFNHPYDNHRVHFRDTTDFRVSMDFPKWVLHFSEQGEWSMSIASKYTIEKVNSKILILNPLEAYPRMEFTKIK